MTDVTRQTLSLTLLGTAGGPGGHAARAGIASLVTIDDQQILVDAGDGVVRQLRHAGLSVLDVDLLFLTHLHDDHTAGFPALMTFRHTMRGGPLTIIGPPGTRALCAGVLAYMRANAAIRGQEGPLADPDSLFDVREVEPGVVYRCDTMTVTTTENSHYALTHFEGAQRSYALRFDTSERSLVFTGDTGESSAVADLARGADLLVSEMVTDSAIAQVPPAVRAHMAAEHLSPAQVGRLAAIAGVETVVLSHYSGADAADLEAISHEFAGRVIAGEDLLRL